MPSDFCLFGSPKKHVAGKPFAVADVKQAVTSWLQTHDTDFFYPWIQAMVPWWVKRWNVDGDHVEGWCVPSATHVPRLYTTNLV
jgi:hypothetical protein